MKKIFAKMLRWLLGIVLFLFVLSILYLLVFMSTTKKMTPAETARLTEDVYAIRDKYVNMYLVREGDDFIAIDAGIKAVAIKAQMKKRTEVT